MLNKIPNKKVRARLMKQQDMRARNTLKNTYSAYALECTDNAVLYDLKGERLKVSRTIADALNNHSCDWTVSMVIAMRESNGKQKLIIHDSDSHKQCKFMSVIGSVADELIATANAFPYPDLIVTVGWIATYKGNEPAEEIVDKIFTDLGVWGL